jgi:FKBP-type peptidyl-prolyl cis-trans isomerase FklB
MNMNNTLLGKTLMSKLIMALLLSCALISSAVIADEEAAIPADTPVSAQELMTQAADGEVAMPRVRKKFAKPSRMQMQASVTNSKAGYAFLDENQRKPGVVKLKSGLQYKVIKPGAGAKPTDGDIVQCKFQGSLVDGTVFEESAAGKPANIKVTPLVAGLKEAIKLMSVGAKWQIYIPSELGFGSAGKPPKVGPEATLIYDLELLGVSSAVSSMP